MDTWDLAFEFLIRKTLVLLEDERMIKPATPLLMVYHVTTGPRFCPNVKVVCMLSMLNKGQSKM
jgi:hypothetical protein